MKVLVTGATGFIGNYVIKELLRRDIHVIATSRAESIATQQNWFNQVQFIEHDIYCRTPENLFQKFNKPDALIHLAWGELSNFKSQNHINTELPSHLLFLENLVKNGLTNLTCVGTCLEYGMQEGCLEEAMICNPIIAYPSAKNMLRIKIENLKLIHNFSFKWIRLFYMYGKGQSKNSILSLLENAIIRGEKSFNMSLGDQLRDYLPVETVSNKIIECALQIKIQGIINCSSNNPISIKSLVLNYLKENNSNINLNLGYYPYPDYEPKNFWGSDEKFKLLIHD